MLITHDIGSAIKIADRISVFKDGNTVETSPSSYFIGNGEKVARRIFTKIMVFLATKSFWRLSQMALIAKNLGFYYRRDQWIFKEINFEVSPGKY